MLPRVVRFPAKFTDRRSRSLRGLFVLRFHQAATRINRFLRSGGTVSFSARKRGLIAAIKVFRALASFRVSPRSTRTRCRRRERDREKQKRKKIIKHSRFYVRNHVIRTEFRAAPLNYDFTTRKKERTLLRHYAH